jgi:invasion associated locus B (IalB) protein
MRVTALVIVTFTIGLVGSATAGDNLAAVRARVSQAPLQDGKHASRFVTLDLIAGKNISQQVLRVTFPLGMQVRYGTWLIVDGAAPLQSPFAACADAGCVADYEATGRLMGSMKARRTLILQAVNASGKMLSVSMPLDNDFWTTRHVAQIATEERLTPWRDDRMMTR